MSIIATAVKHLLAAGVTGDALVTAIAEMEASQEPKVSVGAMRTRRYRERQAEASQSATCDAPSPPPAPRKERSPTPPKETQPLPTTPSSSGKPTRRKAETSLPEGFPSAELISQAQDGFRNAGVDLDAADQAERFRLHAAKVDARWRDWPAAWRTWAKNALDFWRRDHPEAATRLPANTPAFAGPDDVRQAVIRVGGADLAKGFLDRCAYQDLPERTIVAPSAFIADRLRRDAEPALAAIGVRIAHPHPKESRRAA